MVFAPRVDAVVLAILTRIGKAKITSASLSATCAPKLILRTPTDQNRWFSPINWCLRSNLDLHSLLSQLLNQVFGSLQIRQLSVQS